VLGKFGGIIVILKAKWCSSYLFLYRNSVILAYTGFPAFWANQFIHTTGNKN